MGFTGNIARGFGSPAWAIVFVLVGILAVLLGFMSGGSRRGQVFGTPREPILRLVDLELDGASANKVLRLRITNETSMDWTISVRISKPVAVPIPELYRSDQTGNVGMFRPLLQTSSQSMPVQRFRLGAGQSAPLEFSGPLDPTVKEVGVLADDSTAADHLREGVNRLLKKVRIPFRLNTRTTLHLLHTAILSDPITPFLLK